VGIHTHLNEQSSFEPEAIQQMARAFDESCNALKVFAGDVEGRRIVATRIIDLARSGVIDARALRDRVLQEARIAA
jgi:hypothetical protein